jgi:hypothetical protein
VLIVLDGCRFDLLQELEAQYDFITDPDSIYSVDSKTTGWMNKTFTDEYLDISRDTIYVVGNPNSKAFLNGNQFAELDEVWEYSWDDEMGGIPPRPLTDRTIKHARENKDGRIIVHYMQPHEPFISAPDLGGKSSKERIAGEEVDESFHSVWDRLEHGDLSEEKLWKHYKENLEHVLDDVEILLNNIDADKVVITSDHGNAIGEWGVYGHPRRTPIPSLLKVPWIVTSAEDSGEYTPANQIPEEQSDAEESTVEERLKQLGYVD